MSPAEPTSIDDMPLEERWYRAACAIVASECHERSLGEVDGSEEDRVSMAAFARLRDEMAAAAGLPPGFIAAQFADHEDARTVPTVCSFCDWRQDAPLDDYRTVIRLHALVCPDHPMREVERLRDVLAATVRDVFLHERRYRARFTAYALAHRLTPHEMDARFQLSDSPADAAAGFVAWSNARMAEWTKLSGRSEGQLLTPADNSNYTAWLFNYALSSTPDPEPSA
jgi:hypothetical protein